MARFRDVLANKNFFFLWLGQLISNFGDRLNQMALVALVYQRSPGNEVALAKLISFTIIPVFIIGPIAGVWIDRLNRRNVMIISDILRGALVLAIPFFISVNQILPVYFVIFLMFALGRFFIPAKMALIPELVPKEKLLLANTLQDTTHMIGNVVGLVAAGVIVNIASVGAIGGFYIDSVSFFVSALFIAMIAHIGIRNIREVRHDLFESAQAIESSIRRSILTEIREGLGIFTTYRNMRFVISTFFLLLAGIGAVSCVIIVFVQEAFGSSTRDLGFLGMFLVCGLFFGTVLYGRFGQTMHRRRAVYLSFIASGLAAIAFTLSVESGPNIFIAGALAALLGAAASPIMVSTNTLVQETVPQEARGRIFSSLEAVIHLAFLMAMFAAAYAARFVDRFWILMITGTAFFLGGLFGMVWEARKKVTS